MDAKLAFYLETRKTNVRLTRIRRQTNIYFGSSKPSLITRQSFEMPSRSVRDENGGETTQE